MKETTFQYIFHVICLLTTFALVFKSIQQYIKDDDTTLIEYKMFHEAEEAIYPSIGICFPKSSMFDYNKINQIVSSEPQLQKYETYWNCLQKWHVSCYSVVVGQSYDSLIANLLEIADYDHVTTDLMTHLSSLEINLQNDGKLIWSNQNSKLKLSGAFEAIRENKRVTERNFTQERTDTIPNPNIYASYKSYRRKCYSLDVPFIKGIQINYLKLSINGSMFRHGIRPSRNEFKVRFHYPTQQLMSISTKRNWASKYKNCIHYKREIYLSYINVVQRRNKPNRPCHTKNHDQDIIERATERVGCKYHAFQTPSHIPFCRKQDEIRAFRNEFTKNIEIPPCRRLAFVFDSYKESDLTYFTKDADYPKMDLEFHYPDHSYKEVIYIKAYTFESLFGNIGGYVG